MEFSCSRDFLKVFGPWRGWSPTRSQSLGRRPRPPSMPPRCASSCTAERRRSAVRRRWTSWPSPVSRPRAGRSAGRPRSDHRCHLPHRLDQPRVGDANSVDRHQSLDRFAEWSAGRRRADRAVELGVTPGVDRPIAGTPMRARVQYLLKGRPSRPVFLILVATLFNTVGYQVFIPIMPIFLTRRGATPFIVGFVSAIALLSYGLGQYPAGWLADRFDRRRIVALATLAAASFFVVYLLPLPLPVIICVRFCHAASGAVFTPGALALVADLTPRQQVSRAFGFFQVATMSGLLRGPLAAGG